MAKRGRKSKTPLEKLQAIVGPELCLELEALDDEALRARIAAAEADVATVEKTKADDEQLASLVAQAREAGASYRDSTKRLRAIQRYAHMLREAKGKA